MTHIRAHLMDCTSRTGRAELESAFADALISYFGDEDRVADAKSAHDSMFRKYEEFPCASPEANSIMERWIDGVNVALNDALESEGWLSINDSAHMEVTVS